MRVLLISGTAPPHRCGVGDYASRLARELLGAGVDAVDVVTSRGAAEPDADRIRIHPVMERWSIGEAGRLASRVRSIRADVAHLHYPSRLGVRDRGTLANALPLVVRRATGGPVLTTLHEFGERRARFRARAWLTALASDGVVFTHGGDREAARPWPGLGRRPTFVIPIAPSVEPPAPDAWDRVASEVRRGLGLPENGFLVVHFGVLGDDRGLDRLSRIGPALAGEGIEIVVVGDPAPGQGPVPGSGVRRLPHLSDVDLSALLQAAGAGAFPFRGGASPRRSSLLTALHHGLPSVTTRGPGGRDGLVDGEHALVVEEDDRALAAALRRLRDEPDLRARLATGGRAHAGRASWSDIAQETVSSYRRVLGRAR